MISQNLNVNLRNSGFAPGPANTVSRGRVTAVNPELDNLFRTAPDTPPAQEPKPLEEFTISISDKESVAVSIHKTEDKHYIKVHNKRSDEEVEIDIRDATRRPDIMYVQLIIMAISSSKQKALRMRDIYKWIAKNIPFYRSESTTPPQAAGNMTQTDSKEEISKVKDWRGAVRRALSLNKEQLFKQTKDPKKPKKVKALPWAIKNHEVARYLSISGNKLKPVFDNNEQPGAQAFLHRSSTATSAQVSAAITAQSEAGYQEGEPAPKVLKLEDVSETVKPATGNDGLSALKPPATLGNDGPFAVKPGSEKGESELKELMEEVNAFLKSEDKPLLEFDPDELLQEFDPEKLSLGIEFEELLSPINQPGL